MNLQVKDTKTEITHFAIGKDFTEVKKVRSVLEDESDKDRRNILCDCALKKFDSVRKNHFIKISLKIFVYQTFVKPILQYNSSSWVSNKRIQMKTDIF